eukprot:c13995_g1_i2.p1 GENE.c13995_g1_i2~~c13995_g1_i2.p1  ORF type:complete len:501 (-),score=99.34 c13995_g1_i2:754-2256(-)
MGHGFILDRSLMGQGIFLPLVQGILGKRGREADPTPSQIDMNYRPVKRARVIDDFSASALAFEEDAHTIMPSRKRQRFASKPREQPYLFEQPPLEAAEPAPFAIPQDEFVYRDFLPPTEYFGGEEHELETDTLAKQLHAQTQVVEFGRDLSRLDPDLYLLLNSMFAPQLGSIQVSDTSRLASVYNQSHAHRILRVETNNELLAKLQSLTERVRSATKDGLLVSHIITLRENDIRLNTLVQGLASRVRECEVDMIWVFDGLLRDSVALNQLSSRPDYLRILVETIGDESLDQAEFYIPSGKLEELERFDAECRAQISDLQAKFGKWEDKINERLAKAEVVRNEIECFVRDHPLPPGSPIAADLHTLKHKIEKLTAEALSHKTAVGLLIVECLQKSTSEQIPRAVRHVRRSLEEERQRLKLKRRHSVHQRKFTAVAMTHKSEPTKTCISQSTSTKNGCSCVLIVRTWTQTSVIGPLSRTQRIDSSLPKSKRVVLRFDRLRRR